LLSGDILHPINTGNNQTAVSTIHVPVNDYLVPLLTCTLTDAIVCLDIMICCSLLNTIIVIIVEFWDFFVVIAMIGIGIGHWYRWSPILLGIGYWVPFLVSL